MTDAGGLGAVLREALNDSSAKFPNGLMWEKRKCFAKGCGTNRLEMSQRWVGLGGVLGTNAGGAPKRSWPFEVFHHFWTSRRPRKVNLISPFHKGEKLRLSKVKKHTDVFTGCQQRPGI